MAQRGSLRRTMRAISPLFILILLQLLTTSCQAASLNTQNEDKSVTTTSQEPGTTLQKIDLTSVAVAEPQQNPAATAPELNPNATAASEPNAAASEPNPAASELDPNAAAAPEPNPDVAPEPNPDAGTAPQLDSTTNSQSNPAAASGPQTGSATAALKPDPADSAHQPEPPAAAAASQPNSSAASPAMPASQMNPKPSTVNHSNLSVAILETSADQQGGSPVSNEKTTGNTSENLHKPEASKQPITSTTTPPAPTTTKTITVKTSDQGKPADEQTEDPYLQDSEVTPINTLASQSTEKSVPLDSFNYINVEELEGEEDDDDDEEETYDDIEINGKDIYDKNTISAGLVPADKMDNIPYPRDNYNTDDEDSHFFIHLVILAFLVAIAYITYHNKRKIFHLAHSRWWKEGICSRNTVEYHRLDQNVNEAMPSLKMTRDYIF